MIRAVLADHNLAGHLKAILTQVWLTPDWIEFWKELQIEAETFESLGLDAETKDLDLWQLCQREQFVLITANRNHDGEESLNAVIENLMTEQSLPVITIGDDQRIWTDREYAETVALKILDRLTVIESLRGTGRLYVP